MAASKFLCSTDEKMGLKKQNKNKHNTAEQQENRSFAVFLNRSQPTKRPFTPLTSSVNHPLWIKTRRIHTGGRKGGTKEEGRLVFGAIKECGKTKKPVHKRKVCPRVKAREISGTCALPEQSLKYLGEP